MGYLPILHRPKATDVFASDPSPPNFWWIDELLLLPYHSWIPQSVPIWFPLLLLSWYFSVKGHQWPLTVKPGGFLSASPSGSSQNHWTPDRPLLRLILAPHSQPFFSWFFLMLQNGGMSPMFCFLPILFSWNSLVRQVGLLLFLLTRANIYWVRRVERVKHITLTRTLGGWWCCNPILQMKRSRQKAVEELVQDHIWRRRPFP